MSDDLKAQIDLLAAFPEQLKRQIQGLEEAALRFRPAADEWSIDENLEHITLTSHFLLKVIRKGVDRSLKRAKLYPIAASKSDLERMADVGHRRKEVDRLVHFHLQHVADAFAAPSDR